MHRYRVLLIQDHTLVLNNHAVSGVNLQTPKKTHQSVFFDDHHDLLFLHLLAQNAIFHLEDGLAAQVATARSLRPHCLAVQHLQILKVQNQNPFFFCILFIFLLIEVVYKTKKYIFRERLYIINYIGFYMFPL